jgi:hypothetical protein
MRSRITRHRADRVELPGTHDRCEINGVQCGKRGRRWDLEFKQDDLDDASVRIAADQYPSPPLTESRPRPAPCGRV